MAFGVLVGGRIARRVLSGIIRRGGVRLGGRGGLLRSFLRGKADDIGFDLQDLRRSVRRQPGIRITGKAITRRYNRRGSRTSVTVVLSGHTRAYPGASTGVYARDG